MPLGHAQRHSCAVETFAAAATTALVLSLTTACSAGVDRAPMVPISLEDVLAIRATGAPGWSPEGSRVAFSWGVGTETSLWVADAASTEPAGTGAESPRQVSPLTDRSASVLSPDWSQMAYVSKKAIWRIPLGGGQPVQLAEEEGKYSNLVWSPDGAKIAFMLQHEDPDQTDVGVIDADADAGGIVAWLGDSLSDEDSPIWAPNSNRLAYQRRTDDWQGFEIWLTDPDGANQMRLVAETYEKGVEEFRFDGNHHWSPDGARIVYLSSRTGFNHLWVISVGGGEPVELTAGEYVDYSPRWSPSGNHIAFVSSRTDNLEQRHIWTVDAAGGEPTRISPDGFSIAPTWSPDGTRVAYLQSSATQPPEIVVQQAVAGAPAQRLTESRPEPSLTTNFVAPEAIRYPSRDGAEVPAILLRPSDPPEGSRPGLLWFHGKGGINLEGWGGLPNYAFHQRMVQQGYSIVFVNWRGTHIGYGSEWERANYRDYAGGELDDAVAAADFLVEEAGVDPSRIGCWGGSYGGYMTMLAVAKAPDACDAGVSLYGVSDWETFLDQSQRKLWNVRLLAKLGAPAENTELYQRSAAIRFAEQVTSPLLILQGQDDDGVVPEQGIAFYEALRAAGKDADYFAYIGEGHGFRHTGSLRDLYQRVEAHFRRHLGDG